MSRLHISALRYQHCGPIDLVIEPSECAGVYGKSGSGKSLMLRALADLDPHEGDMALDGVYCSSLPACQWRKQVALLPADSQWWFDTVGEHFRQMDQALARMLGFSEEVMQWQVSRLSSGEKQRLALLRLLQNRPQVLLLDEPTANLDTANEKQFERIVSAYLASEHACAIWVSHDVDQLKRVSRVQYEMRNGLLTAC